MPYSRSRTHQKQQSRKRSRTRRLLVVNLILLFAVIVAGVLLWKPWDREGGNAQRDSVPASPSASHRPTASASTPAPDPTEEPSPPQESVDAENDDANEGKVTFAFVGDILPAARVAELMAVNGYDYPYRQARSYIESADVAAGNLESSITDRGTPAQNKQYLFRGPKEALPALKEAGFDILGLANNHTLDFGWVGLRDTMDALEENDISFVGAGEDDTEAYTPFFMERNGLTIGFVSVTRVVPETSWKAGPGHPGLAEAYDPSKAVSAIREADRVADVVVVLVHWGEERAEKPIRTQSDLGHSFVDAGADLVIGSHPHVLQGFEAYKGKWIAHSLGNFVFSTTANSKTSETGVLNAECTAGGECALKFNPMFAKNSQPAPMEPEAARVLLARLSELSLGAVVKENGEVEAR